MATGLEVRNDANILQVDGAFRNLGLVRSIDVICNSSEFAGAWRSGSFVTNELYPLIASAPLQDTFFALAGSSGNSKTWRIYTKSSQDVAVRVYIFADVVSDAGNYGLQVFGGAGEKIFDSNYNYMRVVDYFAGVASASGGDPVSGTRSYSGRTLLGVQLARPNVRVSSPLGPPQTGPWLNNYQTSMFRLDTTRTQLTYSVMSSYATSNTQTLTDPHNNLVYGFMILDATSIL